MISYDEAKSIAVYILTGIGSLVGLVFLWLAKSTHEKWRQITKWHEINKEISIINLAGEIIKMKDEQSKMKDDIRNGWERQREHMDNNQKIILERIDHANESNKQGMVFMERLLEIAEQRIQKLEDDK